MCESVVNDASDLLVPYPYDPTPSNNPAEVSAKVGAPRPVSLSFREPEAGVEEQVPEEVKA